MVLFWMTLCIFFFPWTCTSRGIRRLFPCIVSLPLSPKNPKTDKTHTHGLPPDEKKERDKPCDRRPSGYLAILPLCHDWTGVVALSFPFPPYKYQGTKKRTDEEKKEKGTTKKNREERGEKHKRKGRRKKHGRTEQGKGRKEKRKKINEKRRKTEKQRGVRIETK